MPIEIAFLGAGGIARAHLGRLRNIEDVAVSAVADVDEARAQQVAAELGAAAYADPMDLLEAETPDAVYVCLPPAAHGSLELELALRGVPFYIEKPIHLDLEVAVEVDAAVAERRLVTCVGYQLRYSDAVRAAARYLEDRQLTLVQGFYVSGLPGTPWWRRKAISGGQVVEQSTHTYDLMRYLAGEVETVYAMASTGAMTDIDRYDVEDASVAALEFANGAVGHCVSACVLKEGGRRNSGLRFDGRAYTVILRHNALEIIDPDGEREQQFPEPDGGWMGRADAAFIEAVRTGEPGGIRSDYADSLRTLALTLAVNRSMEIADAVHPEDLLLAASR